jgi:hypothetical protein
VSWKITDWIRTGRECSDTLKQIEMEANRYLPPAELKQQG